MHASPTVLSVVIFHEINGEDTQQIHENVQNEASESTKYVDGDGSSGLA
jgi:hypothetical protein